MTPALVTAIERRHGRHFGPAGIAPRGPNVQQHPLASQIRETERLAAQRWERQVDGKRLSLLGGDRGKARYLGLVREPSEHHDSRDAKRC